jgi:hypothetical protein
MKKLFVVLLCIIAMGYYIGTVNAEQGEEKLCIPLGTITISPPEGVEAKRSPVEFPHSVHFNYGCKECHHKWTGNTEDLSCMASGCHDSSTSLLKTDKDQAYRYFKTAYHNQCIVCHKDIKETNEKLEMSKQNIKDNLPKTGPTGCVECHPKN